MKFKEKKHHKLLANHKRVGFYQSLKHLFSIIYEVGIKEFLSVLIAAKNFFLYSLNPNIYNLNPSKIISQDQKAKITILLHGSGGGSYCFLPLAKKLKEENFKNIFSVELNPTKKDPVPTNSLDLKIEEILKKCEEQHIKNIDITLIGHSLGAIVGYKYIWRKSLKFSKKCKISKFISIAGRLKFIDNKFSWFCKKELKDIFKNEVAVMLDPQKVKLFTIRGDSDKIVPKGSCHVNETQRTIPNIGHGGIIYSKKAIDQIIKWLKF